MVGYSSSTGKYQTSLRILGKLIFLGEYRSFKEAEQAEKAVINNSDSYLRLQMGGVCVNK